MGVEAGSAGVSSGVEVAGVGFGSAGDSIEGVGAVGGVSLVDVESAGWEDLEER